MAGQRLSSDVNLDHVHDASSRHEDAVRRSERCGCFYCLSLFPPSEITDWLEEPPDSARGAGKTAVCPKCGVDAVVPETSPPSLAPAFLPLMRARWFGRLVVAS